MQWYEVKYHSFVHSVADVWHFIKCLLSGLHVLHVIVFLFCSAKSFSLQVGYLVAQTSPLNWCPARNIISMSAPLLLQITVVLYMMQPVKRGSAEGGGTIVQESHFLCTFPFTLMSATKWQNKWGALTVHAHKQCKMNEDSRFKWLALLLLLNQSQEEVRRPEPEFLLQVPR